MTLATKFSAPYRITNGKGFRFSDTDPGDTGGIKSAFKQAARKGLREGIAQLSQLQEKLYAENHWAVLLIFQAMDAAGKDSTIKHVMSGVNPQGCEVYSFKTPSDADLNHDYLWRTTRCLPERGRIGIFNRSYYEEVLIVRVHQKLLQRQKLPPRLVTKAIWRQRFEDINAFERYLSRNGTVICKFFLNVSQHEQKRRFLSRLDEPDKHWKFSLADVHEREYWYDYLGAYEAMIRHTSTDHAPWHVVPADNKWFTRLVVVAAVIAALERLDLAFPAVSPRKSAELKAARAELLHEARRRQPRRG